MLRAAKRISKNSTIGLMSDFFAFATRGCVNSSQRRLIYSYSRCIMRKKATEEKRCLFPKRYVIVERKREFRRRCLPLGSVFPDRPSANGRQGVPKLKDTTLKPTLTLLPNNTILEVNPMKKLISCEYNFDNCCVELKYTDGSMIAIDTIAVENEVARNMYERSELDYLIYNAPLEYVDLILNGDPEAYLRTVTEYKPLD